MTITYRTSGAWGAGKGGPLTSAEIDGNFYDLAQQIAAVVADVPSPVEITGFSVAGTQFTVQMSDGTELGPYTLPKQTVAPPTVTTMADATMTLGVTSPDKFYLVTNPSGCAVTFPPNADAVIAVGSEVHFSQEDSAGPITFLAGTGVTLKKRADREAATDAAGAVVTAKKIATNVWRIFGDLAVVTP